MSGQLHIKVISATDTGRVREHNEDALCVVVDGSPIAEAAGNYVLERQAILAVADGMGGMNAGEVASEIAVSIVKQQGTVSEDGGLEAIISDAHDQILAAANKDKAKEGMGTTLILGKLQESTIELAWSGDSRAYLFNSDGVEQLMPFDLPFLRILTNDHSLVWQQVLSGDMSSEQARTHEYGNIITQSLGDPATAPSPDSVNLHIRKGDKILMCSDGLNGMLADEQIQQMCQEIADSGKLVKELIGAANDAGGADNVTVILVEVLDAPEIMKPLVNRPHIVTQASTKHTGDAARIKTTSEVTTTKVTRPAPKVNTRTGILISALAALGVMMIIIVLQKDNQAPVTGDVGVDSIDTVATELAIDLEEPEDKSQTDTSQPVTSISDKESKSAETTTEIRPAVEEVSDILKSGQNDSKADEVESPVEETLDPSVLTLQRELERQMQREERSLDVNRESYREMNRSVSSIDSSLEMIEREIEIWKSRIEDARNSADSLRISERINGIRHRINNVSSEIKKAGEKNKD